MTTLIDSLLVSLGIDASGYNKGQKDAKKSQKELNDQEKRIADQRKQRAKELEEQSKKAVDGIKKLRNQALALFAVFTAGKGIKDFVSDTIDQAAALGRLSENLKMSTQDITAWQRAAERTGGSADGMVAQLKESADAIAQLKVGMGPGEGMQWFLRYGGTMADLKDGTSYLVARARVVSQLFAQDPTKAAIVAKNMGISDDQFNLIKQGPDAINKLVDAQRRHAVITAEDSKRAQDLRNKWLDFRDAAQSTATKLLLALTPALEKLMGWFDRLAEKLSDNKGNIAKWIGDALDKALPLMDEFAQWLKTDGWSQFIAGAKDVADSIKTIADGLRTIKGIMPDWLGPKHADPEENKLIPTDVNTIGDRLGRTALRNGKKDAKRDDIGSMVKMGLARTFASFGNRAAGEYVRDATGRDDYSVGPNSSSKIMKTLQSWGWSAEQAAGITASFVQESNLREDARNEKSGAYGVGQWLGSRVGDFKKWSGRDLVGSSLDQQLRFFQYEVTQGKEKRAGDMLRAAKTVEEAARIHTQAYERPGVDEANIDKRQMNARQLLNSAQPVASVTSSRSVDQRSELNISTLNINTKATDAQGIAQSMSGALGRYGIAMQANTGVA